MYKMLSVECISVFSCADVANITFGWCADVRHNSFLSAWKLNKHNRISINTEQEEQALPLVFSFPALALFLSSPFLPHHLPSYISV